MKKIYWLVVVALISVGCYAQKSNVKQAKSLSSSLESPDFDKAHKLIEDAIIDPSTKDLTETWYVAGLIGYKELEYDIYLAQMGQAYDEKRLYEVVEGSYDYFLEADRLSQIPNAKGKVDQKTRKQIADMMVQYYKRYLLANAALEQNNDKNYEKAYELMKKHYSIPKLEMMQNAKLQENFVCDSTCYLYYYYMGRFAYEAKMYDDAIGIFETMQQPDVRAIARPNDVKFSLEFLAMCQLEKKDTLAYINTMKKGIETYPDEEWFTTNLVNHYIFSNQYDEAINYLQMLIEKNPNAIAYHLALGDLHERQDKLAEATVDYENVITLDKNNAAAWAGKGRCVYNEAVHMNEQVADIQDAKLYNQKLKEMNDKFAESLPYFQKAHELDKTNRNVMVTLKGLYYRLKMEKEYEAINNEINGD